MLGLTPFGRNQIQKREDDFLDFYNMFDDFFNDRFPERRTTRKDSFKMDIKEKETEYLVEAELPGVKKEQISIDYNDDRLIISVKQQDEINEEKENYIHRERRLSSMQRLVYLKNMDVEKIKAKLEEGVLKITVPKKEEDKGKYEIVIE
ncbi:HSP20 family protein [Acetoanaerobium pronyense]|uniref:HSP20 family protein n=1 Tax=Acetoanaerobium pronyense TaxID=1482736 RepID=A0ABS4KG90_9FIRM|nr:Hsp20/alpha crystallin family protein [Acetoanaerobium pronyense]MBP2026792.1 HSP20 family protein [Acetoanaerobium pronyense]